MKKVKSLLRNPYLLGAQGFLAGALLLNANPQVLQGDPVAPPPPEVQMVPSVR